MASFLSEFYVLFDFVAIKSDILTSCNVYLGSREQKLFILLTKFERM